MHICPNGKKYVGITNNIKQRWSSFGLNYENCTRFYSAIRKYGWTNIEHKILKDKLSQIEAWEIEEYYIDKYNLTNPRNGYNISAGGNGVNVAYRKVLQYDSDGNIIQIFDNQTDASNKTGIHQATISKICLHKQRTTKDGYVFRYDGDPFDINNCDTEQLRIPIYQLDKNKNIICKYDCISDAARKIGCNWSSINSALNKDNRKCCEYYWCTKDNYDNFNPIEINKNRRVFREISQYDLDNNYIATYKSMREAGESIGINHSNISLVCKGEREQAGGYIWRYAD